MRVGPVINHPCLGALGFDGECIWSGKTVLNGKQIEFALSGDANGPDRVLVQKLSEKVKTIETLQEQVFAFLKREFTSVKGMDLRDFEIDSLEFLWPDHPGCFMVLLRLDKDVEGIWKVEFVDDAPKYLSRDD